MLNKAIDEKNAAVVLPIAEMGARLSPAAEDDSWRKLLYHFEYVQVAALVDLDQREKAAKVVATMRKQLRDPEDEDVRKLMEESEELLATAAEEDTGSATGDNG
jgi:hypothetical protein